MVRCSLFEPLTTEQFALVFRWPGNPHGERRAGTGSLQLGLPRPGTDELGGRGQRRHQRPLVRAMMLEAMEARLSALCAPRPIQWLSESGSPYIAADTRSFARELGMAPPTTPIQSPQGNGMAKAVVNTLKCDYAPASDIPDAQAILAQLPRWIEHYNEHHPHSALKMRSPRMLRRQRMPAK